MIIRTCHNRDNPYVSLNKNTLENKNLSYKAKGLWATCLAKPNDWEFYVSVLIKESKEGRTAIYSALKELIDEGLCIRGQRVGEKGRWDGVIYFMFETPATNEQKAWVEEELKKKVPHSCFANAENPNAENQPLLSNNLLPMNDKEAKGKEQYVEEVAFASCPLDMEKEEEEKKQPPPKPKVAPKSIRPKEYLNLTAEMQEAYDDFMALEKDNPNDEGLKPSVVINWLKSGLIAPLRAKQICLVYNQHRKRNADIGVQIESIGAYLRNIINKNLVPQPEHAEKNRDNWENIYKKNFVGVRYEESWEGITFHLTSAETFDVVFSMSAEVFYGQLKMIFERHQMLRKGGRNA